MKSNKTRFALLFLVLLVIASVIAYERTKDKLDPNAIEPEQYTGSLVNWTLQDMNGAPFDAQSELKGKTSLVVYWATWCAPCIEEIPTLKAINSMMQDKNLNFKMVSISVDRKDFNKVKAFSEAQGINYPVLQSSPEVTKIFGGVEAIPTAFLINAKGERVRVFEGLTPKEILLAEIAKALATDAIENKNQGTNSS